VLGEGINALGVIRSLGRRGVPVVLLTDAEKDIAAESRYLASVYRIDPCDSAGIVGLLARLASRSGVRPALFFTTDRNLRLVSSHRDELARYFDLQIPSAAAIANVTDKSEFARFTRVQGFPSPRTYAPESLGELEEVAAALTYPAVIKPCLSFQWADRPFKMRKVDDRAGLLHAWSEVHRPGARLVVQEFIEAEDDQHYSYYSFRTADRGELASLLVQKLRVYPIHGGAGSFLRVSHDPEMEALGGAILARLGYVGVASVCFKKSARDGRPFIYEINGRLPQCHGAFQICGVDLPYLMYSEMVGRRAPAPARARGDGKWASLSLDISAFLEYRARGELGVLSWLASYRGVRTCAEFAVDDPRPFLRLLRIIARRLVRGRGRARGTEPEPEVAPEAGGRAAAPGAGA
jgi:D-aspartate ligase